MLRGKNTINVCVDKKFMDDIFAVHAGILDSKNEEYYIDGDKAYFSFDTKYSTEKFVKIIEKKLYKTETKIVGSIIFVEFK